MDVEAVTGADAVLARAGGLILADEARHNLALGILSTARAHPELYPEVEGWVVRDGDSIVGAAVRTPPYNLALVRPTDDRALFLLAEAIEGELPGVVGAIPEVDLFADAGRRSGTSHSPRGSSRVRTRCARSSLRTVCPAVCASPMRPTAHCCSSGSMRSRRRSSTRGRRPTPTGTKGRSTSVWPTATPDSGSGRSTDAPSRSRGSAARPRTASGSGPSTPPPELRGNGYASAVTAEVSRLQLERGRRLCFLYTDLANPTSNGIYVRIGYERVCDSRELAFQPTS